MGEAGAGVNPDRRRCQCFEDRRGEPVHLAAGSMVAVRWQVRQPHGGLAVAFGAGDGTRHVRGIGRTDAACKQGAQSQRFDVGKAQQLGFHIS